MENYVQEWVELDNKHRYILKQLELIKNKKSEISNYLANSPEFNSAETGDSILSVKQFKSAQPLTFKYLENCLNNIISDSVQVENIINYIKSKRTFKLTNNIKRVFK